MNRRVVWIVLAGLMSRGMGFGQTAVTTPASVPVDVYAHFVGTWVGTNEDQFHNAVRSMSVQIKITESKKKDSLKFAYTWGEKEQAGFSHGLKVLILKPSANQVDFHWSDDGPEIYRLAGLDEFSKTGYGTLIGTVLLKDGERPTYDKFFLTLTPDSLEYATGEGADGQPFALRTKFKVHREPEPSSAPRR